MAGFKTHIAVATGVSSIVTTYLYTLHITSFSELSLLFFIGIVSTVLPDLDSDNSKPIQIAHSILSLFIPATASYFCYKEEIITKTDYLFLFFLSSYILFLILFFLAKKATRHRGIFHSIPMATTVALIIMQLLYLFTHIEEKIILLVGAYIFGGFITHLLLDELYSIIGLKKSFLTAMKLYDKKNMAGTLILYTITIALSSHMLIK
jgi:hypothetical protein